MTDTLPDSVTRPLRPKPANDPTSVKPPPYVKDQRVAERPPRCAETVDGHQCHLDHPHHGADHVTNDGKALIRWGHNGRIVADLRQKAECALCSTLFDKDPSYFREQLYCSKRCAGRAAARRHIINNSRNKGTA